MTTPSRCHRHNVRVETPSSIAASSWVSSADSVMTSRCSTATGHAPSLTAGLLVAEAGSRSVPRLELVAVVPVCLFIGRRQHRRRRRGEAVLQEDMVAVHVDGDPALAMRLDLDVITDLGLPVDTTGV